MKDEQNDGVEDTAPRGGPSPSEVARAAPAERPAEDIDETVDPAADPPLLAGRYRLEERLGSGGMGQVYAAVNVASVGERVAIKLLDGIADARRFELEAKAISKLKHPNTVRMIEYGRSDDGRPFLVLELLEGRDLQRAIGDGDLPVADVLRILGDVAEALSEAHSLGVVHRDLKPSNLFLQRVGDREVVKVLDFGIASIVDSGSTPSNPRLTKSGDFLGTPAFASPEQVRGTKLDARSDLYSLGMIAYVALSGGAPPFEYSNAQGALLAHHAQAPRRLDTHPAASGLPPELVALVHALLQKDPAERPASAAEVCARLHEIRPTLDSTSEAPTERYRVLLFLAAALLLGAWATIVVLEHQERSAGPDRVESPSTRSPVANANDEPVGPRLAPEPVPSERPCERTRLDARFLSKPLVPSPFEPFRSELERCGCRLGLAEGQLGSVRILAVPGRQLSIEPVAPLTVGPGFSTCVRRALTELETSRLRRGSYYSLQFSRPPGP